MTLYMDAVLLEKCGLRPLPSFSGFGVTSGRVRLSSCPQLCADPDDRPWRGPVLRRQLPETRDRALAAPECRRVSKTVHHASGIGERKPQSPARSHPPSPPLPRPTCTRLTGADGRLRVENDDPHLGSHSDMRKHHVRRRDPVEVPVLASLSDFPSICRRATRSHRYRDRGETRPSHHVEYEIELAVATAVETRPFGGTRRCLKGRAAVPVRGGRGGCGCGRTRGRV